MSCQVLKKYWTVTTEPTAGAKPRVTERFAPSSDVGRTCTLSTRTTTSPGSVVVMPPLLPSTMGPWNVKNVRRRAVWLPWVNPRRLLAEPARISKSWSASSWMAVSPKLFSNVEAVRLVPVPAVLMRVTSVAAVLVPVPRSTATTEPSTRKLSALVSVVRTKPPTGSPISP